MSGLFLGLGLTIHGQGGGGAPFDPVSLFTTEQGFIHDLTNPANVFQERTGASATTPSGNGGPIGSMKDLSPNNNWAIAPADAARPLWRAAGYCDPDGVDDGFEFTPCNVAYICAALTMRTMPIAYETFVAVGFNVNLNIVRREAAGETWRTVGNGGDAADFTHPSGTITVNGVTGFAFTDDVPHVVEFIADPVAKSLGAMFLTAAIDRFGKIQMYRCFARETVPTASERESLRAWCGEAIP